MDDIMKLLFGKAPKPGRRLFNLTDAEMAERIELESREQAVQVEIQKIQLLQREVQLEFDKWWQKVRKNHNYAIGDIHYEDGGIFELLPGGE